MRAFGPHPCARAEESTVRHCKAVASDEDAALAAGGSDLKLSPRKVGGIVRGLGFRTARSTDKKRGYHVVWDHELAQRLADRFGLAEEDHQDEGTGDGWPCDDPEPSLETMAAPPPPLPDEAPPPSLGMEGV